MKRLKGFGLAGCFLSLVLNGGCFRDWKQDVREVPHGDKVSCGLRRFLKDKGVKFRIIEDGPLKFSLKRGVQDDARGVYHDFGNKVELLFGYGPDILDHEDAHAIFEWSDDSIFSDRFKEFYSGPSREDFVGVLVGTDIYVEEYSSLVSRFDNEDEVMREEVIRRRSLNEAFARYFAYWTSGYGTELDPLFDRMRYNGLKLKKSEGFSRFLSSH